jgi:hypothetical protein
VFLTLNKIPGFIFIQNKGLNCSFIYYNILFCLYAYKIGNSKLNCNEYSPHSAILFPVNVMLTVTIVLEVIPYLRRLVVCFTSLRPGFEPRADRIWFVVDEVALGQVFSEYFDFLCQFSFHQLLHTHHLSSGAGTIGQSVADVPSGLSLTPRQETKKKLLLF